MSDLLQFYYCFTILLTVTKILITTGRNSDGYQRSSEMIDLSIKSNSKCNDWAEYPKDATDITGGVIQDTVVICGGEVPGEILDECYSLNGRKASLVTHMSAKRVNAASLVINKTSLWISGGFNFESGYLDTSEFITLEGSRPGPNLPISVASLTLVAINDTCSMLIGGETPGGVDSNSTFYFQHEGQIWTQGPDLIKARQDHAAGIVTDEETLEKFVVATGGEVNGIKLDSTEILIDLLWNNGKLAYHFI